MNLHSLDRGLAILGAALLCALTPSVPAATITFTNTADSGNGTLRAATGDIINATGVSGTILLTSGQTKRLLWPKTLN